MPHSKRIVLPLLAALALVLVPATGANATTPAPAAAAPQGSAPSAAQSVPRIRAAVLRPGAKGTPVRSLQQILVRVGLKVAVSGTYHQETATAVQRFQIARGL
ncbi:MAG: peptidoglycan-binding protein, partial [Solirubrobacteraceae bacterium]|nr:peptidoglycan-binding protein [Solirubrobacteraceae bacterium]